MQQGFRPQGEGNRRSIFVNANVNIVNDDNPIATPSKSHCTWISLATVDELFDPAAASIPGPPTRMRGGEG